MDNDKEYDVLSYPLNVHKFGLNLQFTNYDKIIGNIIAKMRSITVCRCKFIIHHSDMYIYGMKYLNYFTQIMS